MKALFSFIIITVLSINLYALSDDAKEGSEFYKEANCAKCHGGDPEFFDALNNKAKNMHDLKGWVSACATNLDTGWFPEEQEKVLKYLNETHYKF